MTFLYRIHGADELLYVGITDLPAERMASHRRRAWWPQVTSISWREYAHRSEAEAAERQAIAAERPTRNVVGITPRAEWPKPTATDGVLGAAEAATLLGRLPAPRSAALRPGRAAGRADVRRQRGARVPPL